MGFMSCERAQNAQARVWESRTALVQWCLGGAYVCMHCRCASANSRERLT
jgi:hypothetical protein